MISIARLKSGDKWRDAPVVVLTTSETTTSRMLAVLAHTSVTGRDVAAVLTGLRQMSGHFL